MSKKCAVILAKCQKTKNDFGTRVEHQMLKIDNRNIPAWMATWTFKMKTDADINSSGASSQQNLEGDIILSDSYPGCPYCGNTMFLVCGECGKSFCSGKDQRDIVCPSCNKHLNRIVGGVNGIEGVGDH
jgi:hypothetical protein